MRSQRVIFALVILFLVCGTMTAQQQVSIDEAHFPDSLFRANVRQQCTPDLIPHMKSLSLKQFAGQDPYSYDYYDDILSSVKSLEGIQYFSTLESLDVSVSRMDIDTLKSTSLKDIRLTLNPILKIPDWEWDVSELAKDRLNLSGCKSLERVWFSDGWIARPIDLSHNTRLKEFLFTGMGRGEGRFVSAKVSPQAKELKYVSVWGSPWIVGAGMDDLVNSLPVVEQGLLEVTNPDMPEQYCTNISVEQMRRAESKGWRVMFPLDFPYCYYKYHYFNGDMGIYSGDSLPSIDALLAAPSGTFRWRDIKYVIDPSVNILDEAHFPDRLFFYSVKRQCTIENLSTKEVLAIPGYVGIDDYLPDNSVYSLEGIQHLLSLKNLHITAGRVMADTIKSTSLRQIELEGCGYSHDFYSFTWKPEYEDDRLNLSGCTSLETVAVKGSRLNPIIDLSHNKNLKKVLVMDNGPEMSNIQTLVFSEEATGLFHVCLLSTDILKEDRLDKVIEGLPVVENGYLEVPYPKMEGSEIVCLITQKQIEDAGRKGWTAICKDLPLWDDAWASFSREDLTNMVNVSDVLKAFADGLPRTTSTPVSNNLFYMLDGRRMEGNPVRKGIYIHGGKKVVVR